MKLPMFAPHQHIHLIGIGGAGLSAIARILLERGCVVSGSDRGANAFTDALARAGATIHRGHDAAYVDGADAVIVTSAAPPDHVEIQAALARGIPVYKRGDVIASIMAGQTALCVAGTHGKTTTTAMIAHILRQTGRDPSYIVGGVLRSSGTNAGVGAGAAFVIEADEYDHMFLGLKPEIAVITNVEWDHPDFFPTPDALTDAFRRFVALLPPDGTLIACVDDPGALALTAAAPCRVIPYGLPPESVTLRIPGRHNRRNAHAAILAAGTQGVGLAEAAAALASFEGAGRRFDVRADVGGVAVIDDYAHHPTAIRATLQAARERYPERALWAVWQPHTYSRTRALWDDYLRAFDAADHVIVTDIYAAREQPDGVTTSARFVVELAESHSHVTHAPALADAAALLDAGVRVPAAIVIMSAGDAPEIGTAFLTRRRLL
jgi:UDP-N-acetylmuramate--alanine ligase